MTLKIFRENYIPNCCIAIFIIIAIFKSCTRLFIKKLHYSYSCLCVFSIRLPINCHIITLHWLTIYKLYSQIFFFLSYQLIIINSNKTYSIATRHKG